MRGIRKEYPKATHLELGNAMSVRDYARKEDIKVAGVYKRYKCGKIKIVDFQGYNFVLPIVATLTNN